MLGVALTVALAAAPAFPDASSAWRLDVRGRAGAFAVIEGSPDGHATWSLQVTCGTRDARGREMVHYRGRGHAASGRTPGFGGTHAAPGGPMSGFDAQPTDDRLVVEVLASGPAPCPGGRGELSTGD